MCVDGSAGEITAQLLTIARLRALSMQYAPEITEGPKLIHNDMLTEDV